MSIEAGGTTGRIIGLRRWAVPTAVLVTVAVRLLALPAPLGADESGFTLVGRSWDPEPDSLYGRYFVDRPPLLIALYAGSDALGGPRLIRVVGAVACGVLVLCSAAAARLLGGGRSARWTAACVAALVTNPLINLGWVKGELLALPFVMAGCWLALLSLQRRSAGLAFAAGLVAGVGPHLKQSLLGGLAFAAVLLVTAVATRQLPVRTGLRLGVWGLAGVAVPALLTLAWALAVGVEPGTLWYAVVGFRADASELLATAAPATTAGRATVLVVVGLLAGLALVIAGFLAAVRDTWEEDRVVTVAIVGMLLYDVAAVMLSGSYWRDYLYALVPPAALGVALAVRRADRHGRQMRVLVVLTTASSLLFVAGWAAPRAVRGPESGAAATGAAIGAAARPGDTLVVHGGRPDVQLTSGLPSPYRHLWSLPMRTLDPDRDELIGLLAGEQAPTWLVVWTDLDAWDDPSAGRLERTVAQHYDRHGAGCGGREVYLRSGLDRPPPAPAC